MDRCDDFDDDIDPAIISDLISGDQRYVEPIIPPPLASPYPVSQPPCVRASIELTHGAIASRSSLRIGPTPTLQKTISKKMAAATRTESMRATVGAGDHRSDDEPSFLPRLMTVKQVAEYLGISISAVWRLEKAKAGFPKALRIAGSTRWDRCAVNRYLDSFLAPELRRR